MSLWVIDFGEFFESFDDDIDHGDHLEMADALPLLLDLVVETVFAKELGALLIFGGDGAVLVDQLLKLLVEVGISFDEFAEVFEFLVFFNVYHGRQCLESLILETIFSTKVSRMCCE